MITIKIVQRTKKLTDGLYPIFLRVTKDRQTKYYKTPFSSEISEWSASTGTFNKKLKNHFQYNRLLVKIKDRAYQVAAEIEIQNPDYTLEDFDKLYRVTFNPVKNDVFAFFDEIVEEMTYAGRVGNAKSYKDTKTSVQIFHKSKKLSFREVNSTFLSKYDAFLRSRGGTDGGVGVKMRAIRALFNKAIERGIVKESLYPFKKYKISGLRGKGFKRALDFEEIMRIVNVDLSNHSHLVDTRNYFVFSFYTRGMNFADMMGLEWKDVEKNAIYYTRAKTKGNFSIAIMPPVREILDHYRINGYGNKYVFPLLYRENYTPTQLADRKHKMLGIYNKNLKELATICEITKNVSSYVARHSFANCLKQKGVATDVISESLGHQNLTVTQAYLKELDTQVVDKALEVLL
ncbi:MULTISPECIES: site-specific integrase [Flavobacteriaceae]|jgi:site-specific recombinase XerD|uniref:Site-specific integrase n=1 Tax=Christiangramia sediminis TaxID=2881336 RepID=A0A9X1LJY5_9FLAO|nr:MULTISPECIES: site-specific integrase [Flavobacteriaceae]MCB7481781.1 site-specific integrase [Christiangramia sediminis]WPY98851.1 site-specific integrase [Christiangramia sp. OXR-203]